MTQVLDFLGTGFAYPARWDSTRGGVATASQVDSVRASLTRLFETGVGEQFFLPEYGCDLNRLVFERDTEALRAMIDAVVRQAIARWEPRVSAVLDLQVVSGEASGQPNVVAISMLLRLIGEQVPANFVFPFYVRA